MTPEELAQLKRELQDAKRDYEHWTAGGVVPSARTSITTEQLTARYQAARDAYDLGLREAAVSSFGFEKMSRAPDKELFEKIETLQNVMLASITGGERDNDAYKQIRDELFEIPPLREALPRFVRTCSDLSQFWHFVKSQQNLGSYDSRRAYVWEGFRPLLTEADNAAPIEREAFFVKGSDHDAYVHIRAIFQLAKEKLFIIDPYMDGSIYQALGTLSPSRIEVQILTSRAPSDFALEGQKFAKQHPRFGLHLRKTKDFHDRFVIVDRSGCYLLGASIKDAGNKGFTIVRLEEPAIIQFITNHADQVWTSAASF